MTDISKTLQATPNKDNIIVDESGGFGGQSGHAVARIRALMSGLAPYKRRRRKLIVFQAFLDDSGFEEPVFVLSGYIAPVDWWEDFSEEWQALLQPYSICCTAT